MVFNSHFDKVSFKYYLSTAYVGSKLELFIVNLSVVFLSQPVVTLLADVSCWVLAVNVLVSFLTLFSCVDNTPHTHHHHFQVWET